MPTWLAIAFWWVAFGGTHLLLSSLPVRGRLQARLGPLGFQGLYSLVALATFVPLVRTWWPARHGGPLLWYLREVPGVTALAVALGMLGFALVAASFFQPTPMGMVPGAAVAPRGLARITRHPMFMGLLPWALGHLLVNGWAADVAFFGGFAAFTVIGCAHQDARKRVAEGERLAGFFAGTSLLPFAAVATGRTRLAAGELPWPGLVLGAAAGYTLYWFHARLFALGAG